MKNFSEITMFIGMAIAIIGMLVFGGIAVEKNVQWCYYVARWTQLGWALGFAGLAIDEPIDQETTKEP